MFAGFVRVMAIFSIVGFIASCIWTLYSGLLTGNTDTAIVPLLVTGIFYIIFAPWAEIKKEKEESQRFLNALKWVFNILTNTKQNKKNLQ